MTDETLSTPLATAPVATAHSAPTAATSVAAPATSCCSDHDHHGHDHHGHHAAPAILPVAANSLPMTDDCCSSPAGCSTETPPEAEADTPVDDADLIEALREVIDPELMINIVDLGLVYSINHTDRKAQVEMTLTSPACPAGPQIIMQSKLALEKVNGIDTAEIKLVMSPPWTPDRMTDEARDQLGIF